MCKEPLALLEVTPGENGKECRYKTLAEDLPIGTYELYLLEQDEEPVAWGYQEPWGEITDCISNHAANEAETYGDYKVPLYLHPAPRPEFVRLSEEERRSCFTKTNKTEPLSEGWPGLDRFARAIEDALEEKNK